MADKVGPRLFDMEGQIVVVTGGAAGIGRGAAEAFVEAGATVVIVDTDPTSGHRTANELDPEERATVFVRADIASRVECDQAVASVLKRFGHIDVLVSNAGIYPSVSLEEMTEDAWDEVFDVNVKGMLFMVKAVLPTMLARGSGRIILTSSVIGTLTGTSNATHYGASKAAMLGFMRNAALEIATNGTTINAVLPGYILTEGARTAQSRQELDEATASVPMRRQGNPKDVGYAMLFLASREAGYITGQTLVVDGGLSLVT